MSRARRSAALVLVCAALVPWVTAQAEQTLVAVATNFSQTAEALQAAFAQNHAQSIVLVAGSSGKLYAQIANGAPYHVFLSADRARPAQLEAENRAIRGSRFTYAVGHLALWSPDPSRSIVDGSTALESSDFRKLALANPALAPYGEAAMQTLSSLGLAEQLKPRLVFGENVGQAHALVATNNAELGLVALSYVLASPTGTYWEVPPVLHEPIRQDAVLLNAGKDHPGALAFVEFLKSPQARLVIEAMGYSSWEDGTTEMAPAQP